jgi:hypothetical protein
MVEDGASGLLHMRHTLAMRTDRREVPISGVIERRQMSIKQNEEKMSGLNANCAATRKGQRTSRGIHTDGDSACPGRCTVTRAIYGELAEVEVIAVVRLTWGRTVIERKEGISIGSRPAVRRLIESLP